MAVAERLASLVHVVLFTLPEDAEPDEADALIDDIDATLGGLPTVKLLERGMPSDTAERPIVMTDYDVGLLVMFDGVEELNAYLRHPDHVAFARKWDTRCRMRVVDFQPSD
jgi:hypothetical protein